MDRDPYAVAALAGLALVTIGAGVFAVAVIAGRRRDFELEAAELDEPEPDIEPEPADEPTA